MLLAEQLIHQRYVHPGPLVLGTNPLKFPTPMADRDRTVSRRSKPSSRTTLIGEQPNPWDLLQPRDVMSRHRGAKQRRRYELLGAISLLSPEYLLSVERWPHHVEPPDHYDRLSSLLDLSVLQSGRLLPLHSKGWCPTILSLPSYASVTLWEAAAPAKLPIMQCSRRWLTFAVRHKKCTGWYLTDDSREANAPPSKSPTYAARYIPGVNAKI